MENNKKRFDYWSIVTIVSVLFFLIFFIYPVSKIFVNSVIDSETGKLSLSAFKKFFSREYYTVTILNSFKVTLAATLITMVTGTLMAYIMKTVSIKGKAIVDMIGAYSWIILLGRAGIITKFLKTIGISFPGIYGFSGILLVFVVKMTPLMYLFVSGALKKMDSSLIECAEGMGCKGIRKMRRIILPLILPTILSSAFLVFMRIFCDFGTPMLIGEGYRTIPVLIYNSFIGEMNQDYAFASAMSVIVVFFSVIIFALQQLFASRTTIEMSSLRPIQPEKKKGFYNIACHIFTYLVALLASLPLVVVVVQSFKKTDGIVYYNEFSLTSYIKAFSQCGRAIFNTFFYSILAMVFILVIGVLFSYVTVRRPSKVTKTMDAITTLPYIIPGSIMGISLILGFNHKPIVLT